jgi:hypothetical protein
MCKNISRTNLSSQCTKQGPKKAKHDFVIQWWNESNANIDFTKALSPYNISRIPLSRFMRPKSRKLILSNCFYEWTKKKKAQRKDIALHLCIASQMIASPYVHFFVLIFASSSSNVTHTYQHQRSSHVYPATILKTRYHHPDSLPF